MIKKKQKLDPALANLLLEEVQEESPFPGVAGLVRKRFDQQKCEYCGGLHARACPAVAHIEYYESGQVKSVSYFHHNQWPADQVIWLEDVYEAADKAAEGE